MVLETQRLVLRELTQTDFSALCKILQDDEMTCIAKFIKRYRDIDVPHFLFSVKKIL